MQASIKRTLITLSIIITMHIASPIYAANQVNLVPILTQLLLSDEPSTPQPDCSLPEEVRPEMMRLYLGKALETLREAGAEIGDLSQPFPNIDPFDYYYDGAESIDTISSHVFAAGLITLAEYQQMQTYRARAVSKFLDITDNIGNDLLNLGNEVLFTGVANWYLDEKTAGRGNTAAAQRAKAVLLHNASEGTNWQTFIDDPTSGVYQYSAPITLNMREVALTLSVETEALRVLREDGATNLAPYQAKFDEALAFSKSHAEQIATGLSRHDYAWEIWYQPFYIGMTASALINADEYLLRYTGNRDPEILPRVKALAEFLVMGSVKYNRYDISGHSAGDTIFYRQVINSNSRGQQQVVLRDGDIGRGYIELTSPTLDPDNTTIELINGSNLPQIGNSSVVRMLNKNTNNRGFWGWKYADRMAADVETDPGYTETLNSLINPLFAWLHYRGESYNENSQRQSYANAYWQSWYGVMVYGDGWEMQNVGTSRKQWNQHFWEMKRSFEWLGVEGCLLQSPRLTPLSNTRADNSRLSDYGWITFGPDQTRIINDEITFTGTDSNYYWLSDTSKDAIEVTMPTDSFDHQLLFNATDDADNGYRFIPRDNRVTVQFGRRDQWAGNMQFDGAERVWELNSGQIYRFRLERYKLATINPDAPPTKELVVLTAFDLNNKLISTVHKQAENQAIGGLGFFFRPASINETIPLSTIKITE